VHRDVSPSNILIGYDGAVKLVDFGIAKAAMRQVETRSGSLKGKVSYMSPEQCKGEDIDRRSDVYALGVVLYELLTTTRLFKGDNDYLMMDAIVHGRIPLPRVRRPDLPPELEGIVLRALATDPEKRYQSADELRIALDRHAAKMGFSTATSALASFMQDTFGEVPEPWLDTAGETSLDHKPVDVDGPTEAARNSWTEFPRDALADEAAGSEDAKTRTGSKKRGRRSAAQDAVALSDTIAPPIAAKETRTSLKLGWESQSSMSAARPERSKYVFLAIPPLLAVAGLAVWKLVLDDGSPRPAAGPDQPQVAAVDPAPPEPLPIVAPAPPPPERPIVRVAGPDPDAPPPDPTPPPPVTEPTKPAPKPNKKSPAPAPKKAPPAPATQPVAPTPPPPPTPAPAATPTPAVAPAPVPPEPPKVVEPQIATISPSTVSSIAANHSRQLAACEGGEDLKGDVTVSFQVDANGKVVKSQLSSTIKNAKVSGCILRAVQSWTFPKPPTGAAKGVYSISYQ
jgi:eukaryotic-like serine/threonine-protein kinase